MICLHKIQKLCIYIVITCSCIHQGHYHVTMILLLKLLGHIPLQLGCFCMRFPLYICQDKTCTCQIISGQCSIAGHHFKPDCFIRMPGQLSSSYHGSKDKSHQPRFQIRNRLTGPCIFRMSGRYMQLNHLLWSSWCQEIFEKVTLWDWIL